MRRSIVSERRRQLAEAATQAYAILELAELAAEFNKAADELERKCEAAPIRRPRSHIRM